MIPFKKAQLPLTLLIFFLVSLVVPTRNLPEWVSVLPPLIAIALALIFKEVVTSLLIGIFSGIFLIHGFSFEMIYGSFMRFVDTYLINVLKNPDHLSIIVFSLLIGGMVSIITTNGSMESLMVHVRKKADSRRKTLFATWLMGIIIFFDDYANSLIVGRTMQTVTDKYRISREKLAYIVDSTAAPIASIAFITTWIGAQLDYIRSAMEGLPINQSAYSVFLSSLSFSFYPLFTLGFILMLIIMKRDFGPMYNVEKNTLERKGSSVLIQKKAGVNTYLRTNRKGNSLDAILPVSTLLVIAFGGLFFTGLESLGREAGDIGSLKDLSMVIGSSDPYKALLWASFGGLALAFLLSVGKRTFTITNAVEVAVDGFKSMFNAVMILVLAWILADITGILETDKFLAGIISGNIPTRLLPALIFILSGIVSFSTGSSWGTMAILYPLMLPVAWHSGIESGMSPDETLRIFYLVVSVVLAGAVFGDHCSPISDTTILSSLASGCNHIDHVRTQLPYAVTVGMVSIFSGYLLSGFFEIPVILLYFVGFLLLYGVIKWLGKPLNEV